MPTECVVRPPLSTRLKMCRTFAGLTQAKLAERTGITEYKICAIETGRSRGYLDEIRTWVWLTGCTDQEKDILQLWADFSRPVRSCEPRTNEVLEFEADND